jgi:hypothetical protein
MTGRVAPVATSRTTPPALDIPAGPELSSSRPSCEGARWTGMYAPVSSHRRTTAPDAASRTAISRR